MVNMLMTCAINSIFFVSIILLASQKAACVTKISLNVSSSITGRAGR